MSHHITINYDESDDTFGWLCECDDQADGFTNLDEAQAGADDHMAELGTQLCAAETRPATRLDPPTYCDNDADFGFDHCTEHRVELYEPDPDLAWKTRREDVA